VVAPNGGKSAGQAQPQRTGPSLVEEWRLHLRHCGSGAGSVGTEVEPLANPDLFHQAMVDPELETVVWPNGADLSPEFLYQMALQTPGKII
jgi:hypothetical protein